jgi:hypothetical protein
MKWRRQPYTLQPSPTSERAWIACRKWSWRAAYFGGDTRKRVQLGWGEGYCSQGGAMAQFYTAIPLKVSLLDLGNRRAGTSGIGAGKPGVAR